MVVLSTIDGSGASSTTAPIRVLVVGAPGEADGVVADLAGIELCRAGDAAQAMPLLRQRPFDLVLTSAELDEQVDAMGLFMLLAGRHPRTRRWLLVSGTPSPEHSHALRRNLVHQIVLHSELPGLAEAIRSAFQQR